MRDYVRRAQILLQQLLGFALLLNFATTPAVADRNRNTIEPTLAKKDACEKFAQFVPDAERRFPKAMAGRDRGARATGAAGGAAVTGLTIAGLLSWNLSSEAPLEGADGDDKITEGKATPPEEKEPEKKGPPKANAAAPTGDGETSDEEAKAISEAKNFLTGIENSEQLAKMLESLADLPDDPIRPEDLPDEDLKKARTSAEALLNLPNKQELVKQAKTALEEWKRTKQLNLKLGDFIFAAESLGYDQSNPEQATKLAHAREMLRSDIKEFAAILNQQGKGTVDQLQDLHNTVMGGRFGPFCDKFALLPNLYIDGCGQCEARTKVMTAVFADGKPNLPESFRFGVQVYSDHWEPVVTDLKNDHTYGLVDASKQKPPNSKIYHPAIWLHTFLESQKEASPVTLAELELDSRMGIKNGGGSFQRANNSIMDGSSKDPSLPRRADQASPAFATSTSKKFGEENGRTMRTSDYGRELSGAARGSGYGYANDDPYQLRKRNAVLADSAKSKDMARHATHMFRGDKELDIVLKKPTQVAEWNASNLPQRKQMLARLLDEKIRELWTNGELTTAIQNLEKGLFNAPPDKIASSLRTIQDYVAFMNLSHWEVEDRIFKFFQYDHRGLRNAINAVSSAFTTRLPDAMKLLNENTTDANEILSSMQLMNFDFRNANSYLTSSYYVQKQIPTAYPAMPFPKFEHERVANALIDPKETSIVFKLKRLPPPPPKRPKPPELELPKVEIEYVDESEFAKYYDSYKKQASVKDLPARAEIGPILFLKLVSAGYGRQPEPGYKLHNLEKIRAYARWDSRLTHLCIGASKAEPGSKIIPLQRLCRVALYDFLDVSSHGVAFGNYATPEDPSYTKHPLYYFDPNQEYLDIKIATVDKKQYRGWAEHAVIPKEFLPLLEAYKIELHSSSPAKKPPPPPPRK